jgi:hypothetical protein
MLVVGVPLKRGMGGGQGSLAGSLIEDAACDECVCVCNKDDSSVEHLQNDTSPYCVE